MKRLCFLLMGLFLIGNVSAYTFVDIYLDDSGSALFLGGTDEIVSFPDGVEIKGEEVIGRTQALTSKEGEVWSFSYSLEEGEITLALPKGAMIRSVEGGEIFIKSDRIYVHNIGTVELTYTIGDGDTSSLALWVSLGVLALVLLGFLFYGGKKLKRRADKKKNLVREILGERENLILDRLRQTGRVKGSQLRKICDIPKASFSRHVQELERKGLVKRSGEGKNKFLELA